MADTMNRPAKKRPPRSNRVQETTITLKWICPVQTSPRSLGSRAGILEVLQIPKSDPSSNHAETTLCSSLPDFSNCCCRVDRGPPDEDNRDSDGKADHHQ